MKNGIYSYETNISGFIHIKNNDANLDSLPEFLGKINAERFSQSV